MGARAGRGAYGAQALHPIGEDRAPVQRLLPAHGPAIDERQLRHAEALAQQSLLGVHIVPMREDWIAADAEGLGEIARRGGEPVAELVRNDDEVPIGIEHPPRADQPVDVRVMCRVRRRIENDIRLVRCELAIRLVGEMGLRQRQPALKRQRPDLECLIIRHADPPSPNIIPATSLHRSDPDGCRK